MQTLPARRPPGVLYQPALGNWCWAVLGRSSLNASDPDCSLAENVGACRIVPLSGLLPTRLVELAKSRRNPTAPVCLVGPFGYLLPLCRDPNGPHWSLPLDPLASMFPHPPGQIVPGAGKAGGGRKTGTDPEAKADLSCQRMLCVSLFGTAHVLYCLLPPPSRTKQARRGRARNRG